MDDMRIEWIPINELRLFENNSKVHTKKQIDHIANSIREFGFNDPIAISGTDNTILEGNGRIEAAKQVGFRTLPCIRLDHLNSDEQRAYVIAHNALCLETGFDEAILLSELEDLKNYDFANYGLETEKFITTLDNLQNKELVAIQRVHYLISIDVNNNDRIIDIISTLKEIEGVEFRATCN
ncbi:MAG: ParB/Srx family N-terminal domain-containing protein [Oscillospiraceae bacterium]|nr:ParB/Srx family N-terminal domain-containing protein [Oscillospiraceae bacterium]